MALFCCLTLAIDLRAVYVPPGGSVHGVTAESGPVDLQPAMNEAVGAWNSLIADDWTLDIHYGWSSSVGSSLARYTGWWGPFSGRHIQARVLFNPAYSWGPGGYDLLTVALHEVGHSGIGVGPLWTNEISDGYVDITAPRPLAGQRFAASGEHLSDPSTLMYFGLAPGQVKWPTEIDINAYAQIIGANVVPEPATIAALGIGLALLRRRRTAK